MLILAGCKEKVTQEQLIKGAIEIKLSQWRETQIKSCDDKILVEAEKYVDSVLVAVSLEAKLDTITKPEKPIKPIKPAFREKPDSVVVDPIYKHK
jgi:hypothetical protein